MPKFVIEPQHLVPMYQHIAEGLQTEFGEPFLAGGFVLDISDFESSN